MATTTITFSLSDINYLFFLIPGFIVVWTFRYFTYSEKSGEFEYAGLSFVWGLISLALFGAYLNITGQAKHVADLMSKNIYSDTLILIISAFFVGFFGAVLSKMVSLRKIAGYISKKTDGWMDKLVKKNNNKETANDK